MTFIDPSSNFHPYECDGPGKCIHCDREFFTWTDGHLLATHDPEICVLCTPIETNQKG